jgi:hypothetical protein
LSGKLAGDVANAVLAYGAVKVIYFFFISITVGIVIKVCLGAFTYPHRPFVISFPDVLSGSCRAYSIRWPSSIGAWTEIYVKGGSRSQLFFHDDFACRPSRSYKR